MDYIYVIIEECSIVDEHRIVGFVETEKEAFNIVEHFRKNKRFIKSPIDIYYQKVKRHVLSKQ